MEIGGGGGSMAKGMAQSFPRVRLTVTDVDPEMVSVAARRLAPYVGASSQVADVTDLPFADESFDFVVSYLMLHHVIDWRTALVEAARILRPGGILIGYDLTKTRFAELLHRIDRSPYRMIAADEFTPGLVFAGLEVGLVEAGVGGHVARFKARKPSVL